MKKPWYKKDGKARLRFRASPFFFSLKVSCRLGYLGAAKYAIIDDIPEGGHHIGISRHNGRVLPNIRVDYASLGH
jgi:hypothetical protein